MDNIDRAFKNFFQKRTKYPKFKKKSNRQSFVQKQSFRILENINRIIFYGYRFSPSSKTCYVCGWINTDLKLSNRVFKCQCCGYVENRDLNAAKNILKISRDELTRSNASGEQASRSSVKEEKFVKIL